MTAYKFDTWFRNYLREEHRKITQKGRVRRTRPPKPEKAKQRPALPQKRPAEMQGVFFDKETAQRITYVAPSVLRILRHKMKNLYRLIL